MTSPTDANLHPLVTANIPYLLANLTWEGPSALGRLTQWAGPPGASSNYVYYISWVTRDDASGPAGNNGRGMRMILRFTQAASTAFVDISYIHVWGNTGYEEKHLTSVPANVKLGGVDCMDWDCAQVGGENRCLTGTAMLERSRIVFSAVGVWALGTYENETVEGPTIPFFGTPPDPPWLPSTMTAAEKQAVVDREIDFWAGDAGNPQFYDSDIAKANTGETGDHSNMGCNLLGLDVWAAQGNRREPSLFHLLKRMANRPGHFVNADGTLVDADDPRYNKLVAFTSSGGFHQDCHGVTRTPRQAWFKGSGSKYGVIDNSDDLTRTINSSAKYKTHGGTNGQHWAIAALTQAVYRHKDPGLYWLCLHATEIWKLASPVVFKGSTLSTPTLGAARARGRRLAMAVQLYQITKNQSLPRMIRDHVAFQLDDFDAEGVPTHESADANGPYSSVFMHGLWGMGLIETLHGFDLPASQKARVKTLIKAIGEWVISCWYVVADVNGDDEWRCPYRAYDDGSGVVAGGLNSSASRLDTIPLLQYMWEVHRGELTTAQNNKLSGILNEKIWSATGETGQWPARTPNKQWRFAFGLSTTNPITGTASTRSPMSTSVIRGGTGTTNQGTAATRSPMSTTSAAGSPVATGSATVVSPMSRTAGKGSAGSANQGAISASSPMSQSSAAGTPTISGIVTTKAKTPMSSTSMSGSTSQASTITAVSPMSTTTASGFAVITPADAGTGHYERLTNLLRTTVFSHVEAALDVPVIYPDEVEDVPAAGPWVELVVRHRETTQVTLGTLYRFRMTGHLEATVWVDLNTGDAEARTVAAQIRSIFQGVTHMSDVRIGSVFTAPSTDDGPRRGKWYGLAVMAPFRQDAEFTSPVGVEANISDTPVEVGNSIRSYFDTQITQARSVATQFDNAPFTQPESGKWVRLTILETQGAVITPGERPTYRTPGLMYAQVFDAIGDGEQAALETVDWIADAFRNVTIDRIRFRTPSLETIGRSREGKWWQMNLVCPFDYDS